MLRPRLWSEPWKGWLAVAGLATAAGCLVVGLLLPVMRITKLWLWRDDYSILDGVGRLWREGYLLLAAIILCFSVVFPVAKLVVLGTVCLLPLPDTTRHRAARWVGVLGRWSMLDVFVVAITIVLSTTSALGDVAPRAGLYVFTAAVLLTMVLGMSIERRCASPGPAPEPRPEGARGAAPPTPT